MILWKQTFYKSLINESIRYLPQLEILLLFQFFSEKCLNEIGFILINIICYFVNSGCLIFLLIFNFSTNLNEYYSRFDDFILIIIFVIMYISLSISSLIILEKCSGDTIELTMKLMPDDLDQKKTKNYINFIKKNIKFIQFH